MYTLMQRDPKFLGTYCFVIKLVILWIQHYSRILWFPQRLGEGVNMCTFYLHLSIFLGLIVSSLSQKLQIHGFYSFATTRDVDLIKMNQNG